MKKPRISRIWIMRIASVVLAPTLFLLIIEGILRLVGYGDPTTFFVPVDGQDKVTGNPRYTYQYFPKQLVREPDLIRFDKDKPEGTYRIFVMGGSAARGTPDPRFGFGRILHVMLEEAYPGRQFEVINTGMVAINSHVVMRIADECADYEPDLFVIYMGNNEAVGPFGVGTDYNEQSPGRGIVALSLAAKSSRTGQLIRNAMENVGGKSSQPEWLGMETFKKHRVSRNDPRLQKVYNHFEANLNDIVETAEDAEIPMILCTVPVNLRNCAPLASDHSSDLDDDGLKKWQRIYNEGITLEDKKRWAEADQKYAEAEQIDDQYAELHFRRGRCALAQGDAKAAQSHYATARDLDTLRFRTDSEINRIIRKAGDADPVILLDAEQRFKSLPQAPHGVPGDTLFHEHVHLTFEGNYELARMVFQETVKQLDNAPANALPSLDRCAELLALSKWNQHQMASSMMNLVINPPFIDQLDYYERCEKIHAQIRSFREYRKEDGLNEAGRMITEALKSRPDDLHTRMALAKLQLQQQKNEDAEKTIRSLMEDLPNRADLHSLLGQTLLSQGHTDDAVKSFDKSIELASQPLEYMLLTAGHYERVDEKERAMELFDRAQEIQPNSTNRLIKLSDIYLGRGEKEQALEELERADSLLPGNGRILFKLSRIHFEMGNTAAAIEHLRGTIKATPFHLGARKHLGLILKKQGQLKQATEQLSMVIPQEPEQLDLRLHRGEIWLSLREFDKAESDYRKIMEIDPRHLNAAMALAWTLAIRPDAPPEKRVEAVTLATDVVKRNGRRSAKPLDVLAAALASSGKFKDAEFAADEAWGLALLGKDKQLAKEIADRLALYRNKKAYQLPARENN